MGVGIEPDCIGGNRGRDVRKSEMEITLIRVLNRIGQLILMKVNDVRYFSNNARSEAAPFRQIEHVAAEDRIKGW